MRFRRERGQSELMIRHPQFCHWAWAAGPVRLDTSWFCPLSFSAPFLQEPPHPDSPLPALGWASKPGLGGQCPPLPWPQSFVQGQAHDFGDFGEPRRVSTRIWLKPLGEKSLPPVSADQLGHEPGTTGCCFCQHVGTTSLRMKSTQRKKSWDMKLTVPYHIWVRSCLSPGVWVGNLAFDLRQAELDFLFPDKTEVLTSTESETSPFSGKPWFPNSWLCLYGAQMFTKVVSGCQTHKIARPNSLHHVSFLLPTCHPHCRQEWPVCTDQCALWEAEPWHCYIYCLLWYLLLHLLFQQFINPWSSVTHSSLYYVEASERSKSFPWVSLAYHVASSPWKGKLHAMGEVSHLGILAALE